MSPLTAKPLTCGDRRLGWSEAGFTYRTLVVISRFLRTKCGLFVASVRHRISDEMKYEEPSPMERAAALRVFVGGSPDDIVPSNGEA